MSLEYACSVATGPELENNIVLTIDACSRVLDPNSVQEKINQVTLIERIFFGFIELFLFSFKQTVKCCTFRLSFKQTSECQTHHLFISFLFYLRFVLPQETIVLLKKI